jgi:serine/threonine-protein phosphatase 2A regulatory subunit A
MTGDPVPNIRFNVAKTLKNLAPKLESGIVGQQIKPALATLKADVDGDVKYYAGDALLVCG